MTTCTRSGCTKKLRKDNEKGVCSSNCGSPDAPPFARAKGVGAAAPKREAAKEVAAIATSSNEETIQRFRSVTEAVGRDPDEMIAEFAQAWLNGLREKLQ